MDMRHDQPEQRQAAALLTVMTALRDDIVLRADAMLARWTGAAACDPEAAADLHNLAAWIALRRTDLRRVQRDLACLGLSSLGRCEGHVLAAIGAVIAALGRVAGVAPAPYPPADALGRGAARLAARRAALFGGQRAGPATRIMATLPPEAAADPGLAAGLVAAGADCVRLNTAHDAPDDWARMAAHARAAASAAGRPMTVLVDLAGPKLRIGAVAHDERLRLKPGARFALVAGPAETGPGLPEAVATISHPEVLALLRPLQEVSINDGKLRARVVAADPGGAVLCEVVGARPRGERLRPEKGVNLPGLALPIPALGEDDLASLPAVIAIADLVGLSFAQSAADVIALRAALSALRPEGPLPGIVLKIETAPGVRALPEMLAATADAPAAVMIARGDLAVEIGLERLSEIQEEILWLCEAASVPVIWATEVLDGMVRDGLASRAEITDAAMGQRADCVMLNKGPHLAEAVALLRGILGRMDRHHDRKFPNLGPLAAWAQP